MKVYTLALTTLLTACGADEGKGSSAPVTVTSEPTLVAAAAKDETDVSLARVDAVKDLPYCERTNNGRIVYVAATKEFKYCEATTGSWYDVDIKGPQGVAGAKGDTGAAGNNGVRGEPGERGRDGAQGAQGVAGQTGERGEKGDKGERGEAGLPGDAGRDGKSASGSDWYDSIAEKWWTTETVFSVAQDVCTGNYKLPSAQEWRRAVLRGIPVNNVSYIWTEAGQPVQPNGDVAVVTKATVYCVEK
jgi:hypothetical protein